MVIPKKSGKSSTSNSVKEYVYRERSATEWQKNQSSYKGFDGDTFLTEPYKNKLFKPKEGHNSVRILPPASSWEAYGHYGLRIKRHAGIGPKMGAYLCHDFSGIDIYVPGREPGKCPICLLNMNARKDGNQELSLQLYARSACLVWIIDRDAMRDGPKLWIMPAKKMDEEICAHAYDSKRDRAKAVDHPEHGYDIEFDMTKLGGKFPNYAGVQLDSEPTPIAETPEKIQRYLQFVEENPIPSVLQFHQTSHILEMVKGEYDNSAIVDTDEIPPETGNTSTVDEESYDGPSDPTPKSSPGKEENPSNADDFEGW